MLARSFRLTKKDIQTLILKKGESQASRYFVIYRKKNLCPHDRFAIAVSKKILKSSVKRNFKRRQVYAILHTVLQQAPLIQTGKDHLIVMRAPALSLSYHELHQELQNLTLSSHFSSHL